MILPAVSINAFGVNKCITKSLKWIVVKQSKRREIFLDKRFRENDRMAALRFSLWHQLRHR